LNVGEQPVTSHPRTRRGAPRFFRPGKRGVVLLVIFALSVGTGVAVAITRSHPRPAATPPPAQLPTVQPTPVPTPSFTSWPDAASTGVPLSAGPLRKVDRLTATKAGTYYSHLDISNCADIEADNITITQSVIHCRRSAPAVYVHAGTKNLTLDQVEIDGGGKTNACVGYDGFTMFRSNLHDCVDGVDFGSDVTVQHCFIHDLARNKGTHNDALQTVGGSDDIIKDNTLEAYRADTGDLMNSAIQTGHLKGDLTNVLVEHNFMDGGNYTVNAGSTSRSGHTISGYVFKDNVFGRHSRYGPVQAIGDGTVFDASNVWSDDGKPVKPTE
jgi:hypothetical protein